jgi:ABC-type glycerol-3-phosphate transport system substrate-binding protein
MKLQKSFVVVVLLVFLFGGTVWAGGGEQKSSGPVTIRYQYTAYNVALEATQQLVDQFNKTNSDIIVEPVFGGGWEETNKKLLASLAAGDAPEVAAVAMAYNAPFMVEGHFENLSKYMANDPELKESDFFKALLDLNRYNGVVYGLPLAISSPVLFYNKDIFRKAGLDPNKPPQTWDEVYEYAKKISALGGDTIGFMFRRSNGYISMGMVRQFGGHWIANDNSSVLWTEPGAVDALKFVQKIHNEGVGVYQGDANLIQSNIVGMWLESCANVGVYLTQLNFDWGNAPTPIKVTQSVPIGGGSIYMFKNSTQQKKDAAWKFLKFMVRPESQFIWSSATGYVLTTQAALNSPATQNFFKREPRYQTIYGPLAEFAIAQDTTQLLPFLEVLDIFNKLWDDTILNNRDAAAMSAAAQEQANKLVIPYKK